MELEKYTICKQCITDGIDNCDNHYDIAITNDENEILINELETICKTLPSIFEKIYLIESVSYDYNEDYHITGKMEFWCDSNSYALFNDIYYPLQSHIACDEILAHSFKIFVDMMRHHPTILKIWKHDGMVIEDGKPYAEIQLIDFMDNLHGESIEDYNQIVKLAQSRLKSYIDTLTS